MWSMFMPQIQYRLVSLKLQLPYCCTCRIHCTSTIQCPQCCTCGTIVQVQYSVPSAVLVVPLYKYNTVSLVLYLRYQCTNTDSVPSAVLYKYRQCPQCCTCGTNVQVQTVSLVLYLWYQLYKYLWYLLYSACTIATCCYIPMITM